MLTDKSSSTGAGVTESERQPFFEYAAKRFVFLGGELFCTYKELIGNIAGCLHMIRLFP